MRDRDKGFMKIQINGIHILFVMNGVSPLLDAFKNIG